VRHAAGGSVRLTGQGALAESLPRGAEPIPRRGPGRAGPAAAHAAGLAGDAAAPALGAAAAPALAPASAGALASAAGPAGGPAPASAASAAGRRSRSSRPRGHRASLSGRQRWGAGYLAVLCGVALSLSYVWRGPQNVRGGTLAVAGLLLAAAAARLVLPEERAGMLVSRRRLVDVAAFSVLGVGLLVAGLVFPAQH
jgi:Protein of unknown function (DUF3017)